MQRTGAENIHQALKRAKTIHLELFAGDEITDIKNMACALSKAYKCKVKFNHNGTEYFCDEEGNCAKIN